MSGLVLLAALASAPSLEARAEMQNLALLRNDADFDRSPPAYDRSGQSVGAFATVFKPTLTFHAREDLRLVYEAELGLNYWSKHNPDQESALSADVFVLKHREVNVEGELEGGLYGFKVGFGRFQDPTGLFLDHWIGAARATRDVGIGRAGLYVGQVPDPVHEGLTALGNNFRRDVFVFGGTLEELEAAGFRLSAALGSLLDSHRVGQTRWLLAPAVRAERELGGWEVSADVVLQVGQQNGVAIGGGPQTNLGWAAQAHGARRSGRWRLAGNLLALSPDDAVDGNSRNDAFLYSGKSRSATVMLTEDEVRDWYDNLDERIGAREGGFNVIRAGLAVADLEVGWALSDRVTCGAVAGAAAVLQPANALDGLLVGVETDLFLEARLGESLVANVVVGALVPGAAGAALVNSIDLSRQAPVVMAEASLKVVY